jgi:GNAT superfamily N-acetyltransferase
MSEVMAAVVATTRVGRLVEIAEIQSTDRAELFRIFADVVERGDGWPQLAPLADDVFDATWLGAGSSTFVARCDGSAVGAYYLKPNFPGRAAHIANAGYIVERSVRGEGIGTLLIEDSLRRAPLLGFDAIQFNLVFSTNPARPLYERNGWREIGRIPDAIDGEEAVIYWRAVADGAAADVAPAGRDGRPLR